MSALIRSGRNIRAVLSGSYAAPGSAYTVQPVRESHENTDYHFSLPFQLDKTGIPNISSIRRRAFQADGVSINITASQLYVYSYKDSMLCEYQETFASLE